MCWWYKEYTWYHHHILIGEKNTKTSLIKAGVYPLCYNGKRATL